ncbi:MAG: NAD(P)-binding domain-containing protein [Steroidobacteraceae bacterium]
MAEYWQWAVYVAPLVFLWWWFHRRAKTRHVASLEVLEEAREAGLTEPVSLHPVIDPNKCLGCGACVRACPEQPEHTVLGLVQGKAQLISPTDCIGHGACKIACPLDAIDLVFGTETRGVTIPVVSPTFETSVPGIYIAGELGGMGLIKNALTQGRQAVEAIHRLRKNPHAKVADLIVIGAGPAGFGAALTATSLKMKYLVLEQESLGGCVFQYPRGKLVMTQPAELPIVGRIKITTTSKEDLLSFWQETERKVRMPIRYQEHVKSVEQTPRKTFIITTSKTRYETNSVLLAIGRRGTPRKLGVPGEDLPKVVYRLVDPDQYKGQRVVVVGGGDSALEAAASIAEINDKPVILSYRGDAFQRAKQKNRQRVAAAEQNKQLTVLLKSNVRSIEADTVVIEHNSKLLKVGNDAVIVNAGGVLPNDFLKSMGVAVETKYGTA